MFQKFMRERNHHQTGQCRDKSKQTLAILLHQSLKCQKQALKHIKIFFNPLSHFKVLMPKAKNAT
jgi:hypothetical protein